MSEKPYYEGNEIEEFRHDSVIKSPEYVALRAQLEAANKEIERLKKPVWGEWEKYRDDGICTQYRRRCDCVCGSLLLLILITLAHGEAEWRLFDAVAGHVIKVIKEGFEYNGGDADKNLALAQSAAMKAAEEWMNVAW